VREMSGNVNVPVKPDAMNMLASDQTRSSRNFGEFRCSDRSHLVTLCQFVSMFAKARCAVRNRWRNRNLRSATQWRAERLGHKKSRSHAKYSQVRHASQSRRPHRIWPHGPATCRQCLRPKRAADRWTRLPIPAGFSHLLVDDMPIKALNCIRTQFARFFVANSLRCECFPAEFASWLSPPRREPSAED